MHVFIFNFYWTALQCRVSFYCPSKWTYTYTSPFFGFPSHLGHNIAVSRIPCAIQQVFSYLFYMCYQQCKYIYICQSQSPNSSHPLFLTWYPLCLFSTSVSLLIFSDSIHFRMSCLGTNNKCSRVIQNVGKNTTSQFSCPMFLELHQKITRAWFKVKKIKN